MSLRLAHVMHLPREELRHIRRGALLHDIGKMGVPDAILLKEGPLSEDERLEMQAHTQHAYKMLSSIPFLRPALDIPYCHHERWDGTGYPRGLKGKEIPLGARIFSVVDVWDALSNDRPYREAWPEAKVLEHLAGEAGKHFDPEVVQAFLKLRAGDA
jgi:HD-GYP domain-containing protein (c-di-GMP phosphodiesterase class II)